MTGQAHMKKAVFITEPEKQIPLVEKDDLIICGGGPAGICAAVAAARMGLKTRLIETAGCLGGILTSGLMSNIIDHANKNGILREIITKLDEAAARTDKTKAVFDIEITKSVLEKLCLEAGVKLRFHTMVTAAIRDDKNQISAIITESKAGREAWTAKMFIDCSGDGDLAFLAGCGFDKGRPENGEMQPMSLCALLYGMKTGSFDIALRTGLTDDHKKRLLDLLQTGGRNVSYHKPTLFKIHDDMFLLMANHEYGIDPNDAEAITYATVNARAEILQHVETLRNASPDWKNLKLAATSNYIGVREGRRIHGLYKVTLEDMQNGIRHEDGICRVTFGVDIHSTNPLNGKGYSTESCKVNPYDIPLRALISRDVPNLLLAGRCISGDFYAHASYRVVGNAAVLGEAAGTAAALAVKDNVIPEKLKAGKLLKFLHP